MKSIILTDFPWTLTDFSDRNPSDSKDTNASLNCGGKKEWKESTLAAHVF